MFPAVLMPPPAMAAAAAAAPAPPLPFWNRSSARPGQRLASMRPPSQRPPLQPQSLATLPVRRKRMASPAAVAVVAPRRPT